MYSFEEIFQAYLECHKNKRNSINALKFEVYLLDNLWELYDAINSFKYRPKRYIYFLTHSPKLREVFASDFRDRVVHHLLVRDLEPIFEPIFIYDSYSCRKKRGTHLAIKRLEGFVQNQNYPYYLQLDLKSFFLSINKDILFKKIRDATTTRAIDKLQRVLYLAQKIIFDDPTKHYRFKGRLVRQRVVNNFKKKKAQFLDECFENATCSLEDAIKFKEINSSYYGHIKHADSFRLMEKYGLKNWLSRGK